LVSDPLKWGALLFVLGFGGYLVMERQLSIGTFVVAVQFTTRMMDALSGLYHFAMETSSKLASVERIRNVLDGEGIREGDETLSGPVHTVRFDDVSFRYGERPVLNGIDLELAAGQKIALVGASGSGKSTIASVLARFFDADRGVVSANGVPISDLRREEWMRRVTVVFQDPYLFPDTIRSNLLLGRDDITEERMVEACEAMMIHDFFRELPDGYDTVIGERGVTLSGGQRQRLALARAVLRDPEILILDEATSSLDLETERRIQANLDRLRRGRMTIVIAHRLSTVRNADRIFVIGDGKVAEAGTHEELLQRDSVYRTLVLKEDRNEEGQLSPAY
jgi:ABC-type multidrug transport system fused ATPase/permease subunit